MKYIIMNKLRWIILIMIYLINVNQSKTIDEKVRGIILVKQKDPLFEKEFKNLHLKITNDKITISRE